MAKASMKQLREELKALASTDPDELLARLAGEGGRGVPASGGAEPEYGSRRWHELLAWRLLVGGMGKVYLKERQLKLRLELASIVLSRHHRNEERRERALDLLADEYTLARGSEDVLALLLGGLVPETDTPEWLARAVVRAREYFALRGDTVSDSPAIHEAIMATCLVEDGLLVGMLRAVDLLTEPYRRLGPGDMERPSVEQELLDQQLTRLKIRWESEQLGAAMIALPHGPMSTLTRESMNLGAMVRHGHARWKRAALKRVDDFVIVGDRRLVAREDGRDDVYIRIPLDPPGGEGERELDAEVIDQQLVAALTQALMRMCREHMPAPIRQEREEFGQLELIDDGTSARVAGLVEEIPRVVAGLFRAASVDRGLSFVGSGEFIDSSSAARLTDIVGLSRESTSSKRRVASVRSILEHVRLRRTVRSEDGRSMVTWEGPIIQRLADTIDVEAELPSGYELTNRSELGIWRIAPELWRMQDAAGPSAGFMLIDERAFELSGRSSDPFNLYWTIIQRAYNAHRAKSQDDRFDDAGVFSPALSVLYTWAGMDRMSDAKNMGRTRRRMARHFESMGDKQIIVSYDAEVFSDVRGVSLDSHTRIDIQLPPSLLCFLPDKAFRSGRNPFARSARLG
jgi:hypothetical protein